MIPKSFQIMGHTYKVKITEDISDDNVGEYSPKQQEILLRPVGKNITVSNQEQTFWHEAVHVIFDVLSYPKHYSDEILVDRLGQCLHQINKTMK